MVKSKSNNMSNSQLVYAGMVCLACMGVLVGMPASYCSVVLVMASLGFFVEQFKPNKK